MDFESVLAKPDLDPDWDNPDHEPVPTYLGTATRVGKMWNVTVAGLPNGCAAQAQGTTWREAQDNTSTCVAELLGSDAPPVYGVHIAPADPQAAQAIKDLAEARRALVLAEQAVRDKTRHAARVLVDQEWSTRDAGQVLRLSHQRISQLAPRT
ncbi:hypothetical protein LO772_16325 [Yinghuangia sp. ASG 101]|uniref:hypothetical protein n=1 Tax=Yinghuangia sp. ASG 101 TaxID=2896848 RepID=UPI001E607CDD|nr:hypothetical protein [Yinghuangia sp. ASG 101]UGQ14993.1 hypothetical protein LO772_16325 [Yinghuangia sp. ASG 101]